MTKILLVEDDKSLREIYGVRLLAEGYDIVSAGDGEEALARAIKERPQLILSDVMMPKISGFDMLDILRSTTETRGIKVIIMTALSSDEQRLRGEQLGADRYLVKSQVGIEDVVRVVHEVLSDAPVVATPAPTKPEVDEPDPEVEPEVAAELKAIQAQAEEVATGNTTGPSPTPGALEPLAPLEPLTPAPMSTLAPLEPSQAPASAAPEPAPVMPSAHTVAPVFTPAATLAPLPTLAPSTAPSLTVAPRAAEPASPAMTPVFTPAPAPTVAPEPMPEPMPEPTPEPAPQPTPEPEPSLPLTNQPGQLYTPPQTPEPTPEPGINQPGQLYVAPTPAPETPAPSTPSSRPLTPAPARSTTPVFSADNVHQTPQYTAPAPVPEQAPEPMPAPSMPSYEPAPIPATPAPEPQEVDQDELAARISADLESFQASSNPPSTAASGRSTLPTLPPLPNNGQAGGELYKPVRTIQPLSEQPYQQQ